MKDFSDKSGMCWCSIEPHLSVRGNIYELPPEERKYVYSSQVDAFCAAVDGTKNVLLKLGFRESKTQPGVWEKSAFPLTAHSGFSCRSAIV